MKKLVYSMLEILLWVIDGYFSEDDSISELIEQRRHLEECFEMKYKVKRNKDIR